MKFTRLGIPELVCIEPNFLSDDRGYFSEIFRLDLLQNELGYHVHFIQENESKSSQGILRGLHYQIPPFAQSKLIRVIDGLILDVIVDIRYGSPYFGKSEKIELSAEDNKYLFIPRGFAHGFIVLSDSAIVNYKVDNPYSPEHEQGIFYGDHDLEIDWQIESSLIRTSKKDKIYPMLKDSDKYFSYEVNLYS